MGQVHDQVLLDMVLKTKKEQVAADLSEAEYFEIFASEQALKDFDLSYDELEEGVVGGPDDGGIDAAYLFVNGELIREDTELTQFKKDIVIDVVFVQAKTGGGFSDTQIEKLIGTSRDLLDMSKDVKQLKLAYNKDLVQFAARFRDVYRELAAVFPKLRITYSYATKGVVAELHPKVTKKVEHLDTEVKRLFPKAEFLFNFLGARELLELARRAPKTTFELRIAEGPITPAGQGGYICLVRLSDYFDFITDGCKLRRAIFEANVRDYQGEVSVNEGIKRTLFEGAQGEDFWWLNNGITIVASRALHSAKILTIENPQIVNGLQTSWEIHKYFITQKADADQRTILVRIIVPPAQEVRDRIIKATNSQTKIPDASLRATEKIQHDIEEFLQAHGLYYDRRKNFYKNEGKPIDQIIGITQLAQAVMAAIGKPDTARARPSSLLKEDSDYKKVFDEKYPLGFYAVCAKLLKKVEHFVKSDKAGLDNRARINLKFHLVMASVILSIGEIDSTVEKVSKLDVDAVDDALLSRALVLAVGLYNEHGATDQVAKGPDFREALKARLKAELEK